MMPRQKACLDAIRKLTKDGVPPSFDELRIEIGLSSKSGVHRLLTQLKRRGLVTWDDRVCRSLRVIEPEGASYWRSRALDAEAALLRIVNQSGDVHAQAIALQALGRTVAGVQQAEAA